MSFPAQPTSYMPETHLSMPLEGEVENEGANANNSQTGMQHSISPSMREVQRIIGALKSKPDEGNVAQSVVELRSCPDASLLPLFG